MVSQAGSPPRRGAGDDRTKAGSLMETLDGSVGGEKAKMISTTPLLSHDMGSLVGSPPRPVDDPKKYEGTVISIDGPGAGEKAKMAVEAVSTRETEIGGYEVISNSVVGATDNVAVGVGQSPIRRETIPPVVHGESPRGVTESTRPWVNIVQKKKVMTKYDVQVKMEDGIGSVVVPDEIFRDSSPLWEDFLLSINGAGKFLNRSLINSVAEFASLRSFNSANRIEKPSFRFDDRAKLFPIKNYALNV